MALKVVMTASLGLSPDEEELLRANGAVLIKAPSATEDELIANCHDAHAILIGPREPFTKRVIDALENCRVLSRMGIGYDNIDVEAATTKGIPVSIVPDYCISEVTDHAMAFILAFARNLLPLSMATRAGEWKPGPPLFMRLGRTTHRLVGQTLGILGFGRIGKSLAPKAQAFGMRVIAHDPYVAPGQAAELGVDLVEFDELLRQSDYISLHAALTPETRHLFNLDVFRKMKPTAYIVNNARGGLIDEQALVTALTEKYIAGAALDVTDPEPPSTDNPLLRLDNVLVTGHAAFYSEESTVELRQRGIEAVVAGLRGEWPRIIANPELKRQAGGILAR